MQNSLPESFNDILSMLGNTDPRLQMIAEFIKKQQLANDQSKTVDNNIDNKRRLRLEQENRLLQERINILAAALGACRSCFGTINTCPICQGQGSVGSQYPVKEAYMLYILPVVQRFGSSLLVEQNVINPNPNDKTT